MNAIIAQLLAAAIDEKKIPDLDWFDMRNRPNGGFSLFLNDGTEIKITCKLVLPAQSEE